MSASNDGLDCTLEYLVRNRETSVRLFNCITANRAIAAMTIREFLSDREEARRQLLGVQNLGRKSATELCGLVESFAADPDTQSQQPIEVAEPPAKQAFRELLSLLTQIPFPVAVLQIDISTRLRNGLKDFESAQHISGRWETEVASLSHVLADWPEIRRRLLGTANLGRKTVTELEALIEAIVAKRLLARCPAYAATPVFTMEDLTEKGLDPSIVDMLLNAADETSENWPTEGAIDFLALLRGHAPDAELPPREHIAKVVSRLNKKEQDVILRRFGMGTFVPQTLEEVAKQFHVTRERVRQVEAKALRRLRFSTNITAFQRLLTAEQDYIWTMLADGTDLLMPPDLQGRSSELRPEFMLSIDVVHEGLVAWASSFARPALGGWLRGPDDSDEIRRSMSKFEAWARDASGPIPLAWATDAVGLPARHLAIVQKLRGEARIFEGYLCPGHLGAQAKRTCRLHRLSLENVGGGPFDVATLYREYISRFPDDDVSPRVIFLQLQRAPHLFFRVFDGIWTALGADQISSGKTSHEAIPFDRKPALGESNFEVGSIGAWLYETLAHSGPMRMVALRDMAETQLSKTISQSSVGAVLQSNPEFVRLAPGVYGLQQHVAGLSCASIAIPGPLLSENHCRYYAMSRRAGDPITLYPAWGYHFEAALCRWASVHASDEVFRSLLAVAHPQEWPVDADEQVVWQDRKRIHGSYRLPQMPPPPLYLPSAADFLAASIYLRMTGSIAWTTINRTAQRRLDNQKAASTLALLVGFGLAAPEKHWQCRHLVLPAATAVIARITSDLVRTGRLSWHEATLAELRNAEYFPDLWWHEQSDIAIVLAGGEGAANTGPMTEDAGLGDLDSIFASEDWGVKSLPTPTPISRPIVTPVNV